MNENETLQVVFVLDPYFAEVVRVGFGCRKTGLELKEHFAVFVRWMEVVSDQAWVQLSRVTEQD